jgi:hypothetical protein
MLRRHLNRQNYHRQKMYFYQNRHHRLLMLLY